MQPLPNTPVAYTPGQFGQSVDELRAEFYQHRSFMESLRDQVSTLVTAVQRMDSRGASSVPLAPAPTAAQLNPYDTPRGDETGPFPKLPKIQIYKGDPRELDTWLTNTKLIMRRTRGISLEDTSCVAHTRLHLDGKAANIWDHHGNTLRDDDAGLRNWDDVVRFLRAHLGPSNPDITGRIAIHAMKQKGSVSSYADAFMTTLRTFTMPMADFDQREHFIRGLKTECQTFVRGHILDTPTHVPTFKEALEWALLYDKTLYKHYTSSTHSSHARGGSATPMELGALESRLAKLEASSTPSSTPRLAALTDAERAKCVAEGLCFRCRLAGHSAKNCPKNPNGRRPAGTRST
jgi:hypothetical protein